MKATLFLNGTPPCDEEIAAAAKARAAGETVLYCTDGAYRYLARVGVIPDVAVGDFDSFPREEIDASCEVLAYDADKDYTDGYLAVSRMIERGYDRIDIFGAYGGRPAMTEYNYALLALASARGVRARLCGETTTYLADGAFSAETGIGAEVSLCPYSDRVHILYMRGLKYSLTDFVLYKYADVDSPKYVMGVSNESVAPHIEIGIGAGKALVFLREKCGR